MAWCYVYRQISAKNGLNELVVTGAKVAFHIGIPADNNEAGMSYREAMLEAADPCMMGVPSVIRDLETRYPIQYAKLQSGETIEIVEEVDYAGMHDTIDQKATVISARAASIEADVIGIFRMEYGLSGLAIDD